MNTVRNGFIARQTRDLGIIAGAALVLSLWLVSLAFSFSPHLHGEVCSHANDPADHCAFKSIAQGQFAAALAPVPVAAGAAIFVGYILPAAPLPASSIDLRLAPSRAPPLFFVLH